ncbi:MAG: hypothetical protein ACFFD4_40055 [Candidatus Odinarchaeota archaeon]
MSLAEKIVAVKAKKFLTDTLYNMASKLSKIMNDWQPSVDELVYDTILENFSPDGGKMAPEKEVKNFLQWLGFTPVEFQFEDDVKLGKIYLGTSRLWKTNPKEDEIMLVLLKGIIAGVMTGYYDSKPAVKLVTDQELPPRYTIYFQTVDEYAVVGTIETASKKKGGEESPFLGLGTAMVEPFIGRGMNTDEVLKYLLSSAKEALFNEFPEEREFLESEVNEIPIRAILYAYQKAAKAKKTKELANIIGEKFTDLVLEDYPDIQPNKAIKGIGFLPVDQINDLMFYGKDTICQKTRKVEFCQFLSYIWEKYFSRVLGTSFVSSEPMCAAGSSNLCLYSFNKE